MLRMAFLSVEDTDKMGSRGSLHGLCQKAHEFDFSEVSVVKRARHIRNPYNKNNTLLQVILVDLCKS